MKKLFILLLSLILVFSFVSCQGDETCTEHKDENADSICDICDAEIEDEDNGQGNTDTCNHADSDGDEKCDVCGNDYSVNSNGDLLLIDNGNANFTFVVANNVKSSIVMDIDSIIEDINGRINNKVAKVADKANNITNCEILIGETTKRGEKYTFDRHDLGAEGYMVEIIDNKIIVLGGSDKALETAWEYLRDTVFTFDSDGKIDDLVMKAEDTVTQKQTNYKVDSAIIAGHNIKEYVWAVDSSDSYAMDIANDLQEYLYEWSGIYLKLDYYQGSYTGESKAIIIDNIENGGEGTTEDGYLVYIDDSDNLVFQCEFPKSLYNTVYKFFVDKFKTGSDKELVIEKGFTETKNLRDIYYKDYGAVGDGQTDDFNAIRACHEYANQWGHTVNASPNAEYYLGGDNGSKSIIIQTDTYWHGCTFIFDDRYVLPDDPERTTPLFILQRSDTNIRFDVEKTSLSEEDTTLCGWVPGEKVLVMIRNNDRRHFIRYGPNQNNGSSQQEMLLINADGTIDPSTPVQWDYPTISSVSVFYADDKPIIVSGGDKGQDDSDINNIKRATVKTLFNTAPSEYTYYSRNIQINRSNAQLKNIEHVLIGDDETPTAAPYGGFTQVQQCNNVVVSGCIFELQASFSTTGAAGTNVGMGSYEINASNSTNVLWKDCYQSNFFGEDGSVKYHGFMGTNYCKNLTFDNMFVCSFDAHCGTYSATIKNSTIEHLNFIGEGTITLENVTMYTDGSSAAMIFRSDYGSTWQGNVVVNGLTMKTSKANPTLSLIKAEWTNHDFGYTTYLPHTIELNDVTIIRYGYSMENGERKEWEIERNHVPLHIYSALEQYVKGDISDPDALLPYANDWKQCNCASVYGDGTTFNDTDGDGRCNNDLNPNDTYNTWCWGFETAPNTSVNANPYVPTEKVYVKNCGDLEIILPSTPQFSKCEIIYLDSEE